MKITKKHLGIITLAIRDGGGPNENDNAMLKRAIQSAVKDNVTRVAIDKCLARATEEKEAIHDFTVCGIGPGGVAMLVPCVTDNVTRTRTDVRMAFSALDCCVGKDGSLDHFFMHRGVLRFEGVDEEAVIEASMETDIEDCEALEGGAVKVIVAPSNRHATVVAFEEQGMEPVSSDIEFAPMNEIELGEEATYKMMQLMHLLEDLGDVQAVHHNAKLAEGVELKIDHFGRPVTWETMKKTS